MKKTIYMIVIFFSLAYLWGCGRQEPLEKQTKEQIKTETAAKPEQQDEAEQQDKEEQKAKIYVQVSGAVVNPGVYSLPEGSRVFEAVKLAGGTTEDADARQMNQAEILSDGQMIYVRTQGEAEEQTILAEEQADGKVNLNTATEEELMTLPGIGQAKAKSILAWREANGSFSNIEDLMKIEGIKEGVFTKMKDSVKVN